MTGRQTAVAAAADLKWLTNSAALLRRELRHTPDEARWWGLVRLLVTDVGLTLKAAAEAASAALRSLPHGGTSRKKPSRQETAMPAKRDPTGAVFLMLDLARYHSTFLANLSRALLIETPRRRGRVKQSARRTAIDAARQYGIDTGLLLSSLARSPAERLELLDANATFLRAASGKSK
ncbi:MAG: hypothetical protein ACRENK_01150 [Gemmatimonadaceae bacterium]